MRITQLRQIVSVAKYGSINKAAHDLDISQPALSTSLRELENELELSLFQRTRKGVLLTVEGEKIVEEAKLILASLDRIQHISDSSEIRPEIKIATGSFFEFMIPDIITAYHKKYPNVTLHFLPLDNLNNVLDDIAKEHYRFCLCCFSAEELNPLHDLKRLKAHILFEKIGVSVVMHKTNPFAKKEFITPEYLLTEQLVMVNSTLTNYHFELFPQLKQACKAITLDTYSALKLVQQNNGISIVNTLFSMPNLYQELFPDVVGVPYKNGFDDNFFATLIAPRDVLLSKFEFELIAIIETIAKKYKSQIQNNV